MSSNNHKINPFEVLDKFFEDTMGRILWDNCKPIFVKHQRESDRFNQIKHHVKEIPDWTNVDNFDNMVQWQYMLDMLTREIS